MITLIGKATKGPHVLRYPVFIENIGKKKAYASSDVEMLKSKKKAYASSDVLFSTESSGDSGTRAEPELQNDRRGDSGTRATRAEPKLRNDERLVII